MRRTIKVSDFCDIYDCLHATPNYSEDGMPMVRVTEIKNCFLDCEQSLKVDEETYRKYTQKHVPHDGDILLARVGAFLGQFALVVGDQQFCIGQNTTLISPRKHSKYTYYYLISPYAQKELKGYSSGSAYKSVGVNTITDFNIQFPASEIEAERIGNFLFNIDKTIQTNISICNTLENTLKLLYDYWFVQFDFPNEDGKPYKSSGGEMVWNDELKREIPAGWEIKAISDLANKGNNIPHDGKDNLATIDMSVMPTNSMILNTLNESSNFSTNLFKMKKGDILFGSIRPYLKKAGIAPCDGVVAGTVHCFRPKRKLDYNFLAITLCNERMFYYANNSAQGTKMPVATLDSLMEYKVPYSAEVSEKFNSIDLCGIFSNYVMENQELLKMRDLVLPMLMTGQATVTV